MNKSRYRREIMDSESATVAVVEAVATANDTAIEEMPLLYEFINPAALDALVERGDDLQVQFEYNGFEVEVTPDEIRLEEHV